MRSVVERLLTSLTRLQALGPGLLGAAIAVLVFFNVVIILLRSGKASPERQAAFVTPSADAGLANAGGSRAPAATATPATPGRTPTPASTATVAPAATVQLGPQSAVAPAEGSLPYVSGSLPYPIAYSAAWSVQPGVPSGRLGGIAVTGYRGDTFLQLGSVGPARSTILMAGETLTSPMTAEQYLETVAGAEPDMWRSASRVQQTLAGANPALIVVMEVTTESGQRVTQVRALFTTSGLGWQAILTSSPATLAKDTGLLLWMLQQFTFRQ